MSNRLLPSTREWTKADYERLRKAALALRKTHMSWKRDDGSIRPSFDGRAYWELLGALDRTNEGRFSSKKE